MYLIVRTRKSSIVPVVRALGIRTITHREIFRRGGLPHGKLAYWGWGPFIVPGMYNPPEATAIALDKLDFYSALSAHEHFRDNMLVHHMSMPSAVAAAREGKVIFCRKLTQSRAGKGIVVAKTPEEVVPARYYTEGVRNTAELRVHFFTHKGRTLVLQKLKLGKGNREERGVELDRHVRTLENGWVFGQVNDKVPEQKVLEAKALAIDIGNAIGLTYGCVDFIYNKYEDKLYIVEANSAPGVKGASSIAFYSEIFKEIRDA